MKIKLKKSKDEFYKLTPEELAVMVEKYFENSEKDKKPLTISGIANHVGADRFVFYDIKEGKNKKGEKFKYIIEQIYYHIEEYLSQRLLEGKNVVGIIFTLKANYQWTEKQQIDLNHDGKINIKFD